VAAVARGTKECLGAGYRGGILPVEERGMCEGKRAGQSNIDRTALGRDANDGCSEKSQAKRVERKKF